MLAKLKDMDLPIEGMHCASCVLLTNKTLGKIDGIENVEADLALALNKPLIGIKPWGQQRIPQDIALACTEIVGWNTDSIIDAIRRHRYP